MIALLAAASLACAGIVLDDAGGRRCTPLPPLVAPCQAVRACAVGRTCAITVTGRVTRAAFRDGEAWGDWLQRLTDAPDVTAAAVSRLAGIGPGQRTLFLVPGRPPLVGDGLATDDLGWLREYRTRGTHPAGLHPAPRGIAARLCPGYASRRAASRAK